jgi:hypothetical protein
MRCLAGNEQVMYLQLLIALTLISQYAAPLLAQTSQSLALALHCSHWHEQATPDAGGGGGLGPVRWTHALRGVGNWSPGV